MWGVVLNYFFSKRPLLAQKNTLAKLSSKYQNTSSWFFDFCSLFAVLTRRKKSFVVVVAGVVVVVVVVVGGGGGGGGGGGSPFRV